MSSVFTQFVNFILTLRLFFGKQNLLLLALFGPFGVLFLGECVWV
jgi:hypothetical protein